jgi:hypothetical protein
MSNVSTLLNHLDAVSKRGDSYRAKCPAHGGRSTSTLNVTEVDDGRILLHCFHGCSALEVLSSIGLEFADIMPERLTHKATPEQRKKWRQDAIHRDWAESLKDFWFECRVVWVAGKQMRTGQALNDEEDKRLDLALVRITSIRDMFNGTI